MVNLVGKKLWSDVRLLESHEYAQGGENGNMNEQAKALLNRTEYLRGLLEQLQQTQQSQQDWQTQFTEQINQLGQQVEQINLKLEQLSQPSTPQQPSISCEGALGWFDIYLPNQSVPPDAAFMFTLDGGDYVNKFICYQRNTMSFYDDNNQDISDTIRQVLDIDIWDEHESKVSSDYDGVVELLLNGANVDYKIYNFKPIGSDLPYLVYPSTYPQNPTVTQNEDGSFNACVRFDISPEDSNLATNVATKSQSQSLPADDYCLSFEITENNQTSTVMSTYQSNKPQSIGMLVAYLLGNASLGYWTQITPTYSEFSGLFTCEDMNNATYFSGLDHTAINGLSSLRELSVKIVPSSLPNGTDIYNYLFGGDYISSPVRTFGYSVVAGAVS